MSTVIVCVCSRTIDSLANAVTHVVASRDSWSLRVILLSDSYAAAPDTGYVASVAESLQELAEGRYRGKAVGVDSAAADRYRRAAGALKGAASRAEAVDIRDLRALLNNKVKSEGRSHVQVDVTCLPKPLAAAVTVTCIFLGLRVYSFDLVRRFDARHPESSMYHALPGDGFRYPCLTDPVVVEEGMREFTPKKHLRIAVIAVSLVSAICFALLVLLKPSSSLGAEVVLWVGLASGILGIGTGFLQLAGK